jgi:hypothetical protein
MQIKTLKINECRKYINDEKFVLSTQTTIVYREVYVGLSLH